MQYKKVMIMVMCSSHDGDYKNLENSIKETWFNLRNEEVEIIFYSDNDTETEKLDYPVLRGNDLILPCADGYFTCGIKTALAFDWLLQNYNFDYVYRSNLGAFVDPSKIINFLEDKPKNGFYCGIYGNYLHTGVKFVSGSGFFLSKDLVELLVIQNENFNKNLIDDVAIGEFMHHHEIEIDKSAVRCDVLDKNLPDCEIEYIMGNSQVDLIPDEYIYHFRLRSNDRNIDIRNMKYLYEKKLKSL
jgi:hypothetical protein